MVEPNPFKNMLLNWRIILQNTHMDVSENSGIPKSSILTGFSIMNHPFWGIPIFGNTHIVLELQIPKNPPIRPKSPGWDPYDNL